MNINRRFGRMAVGLSAALVFGFADPAAAWEPGAHAGDWMPGQTVVVRFAPPPGATQEQFRRYSLALGIAIDNWNAMQAPFGGLKLELRFDFEPGPVDVNVTWRDHLPITPGKNTEPFGSTSERPRAQGPITVALNDSKNLDFSGLVSVIKHELGHVEGLDHSAFSQLMHDGATSEELDDGLGYNLDDRAAKRTMYGTIPLDLGTKLYNSVSSAFRTYLYLYELQSQNEHDRVGEFLLDMPRSLQASDLKGFVEPDGWNHEFLLGGLGNGDMEFDNESPSPSVLRFFALSDAAMIVPGATANFGFSSRFAPTATRAFTITDSFWSDQYVASVPAGVPEPAAWLMLISGFACVGGAMRRTRRALAPAS